MHLPIESMCCSSWYSLFVLIRLFQIKFELVVMIRHCPTYWTACRETFGLNSLTTLFSLTSLSRLILSNLSALLDGVRHHFLLFESLSDVVPVKAEVALLTQAEQNLWKEAAPHDRGNRENNKQVRPLLHPFWDSWLLSYFSGLLNSSRALVCLLLSKLESRWAGILFIQLD